MSSRAGTLTDALARVAHHRPEGGVAVVDGRGRRVDRRGWADVRASGLQAAARLRAAGVVPGDRVLIGLPTSWDWIDAWLGALLAGALPAAAASPGPLGSSLDYAQRIAGLAACIGSRAIVAGEALRTDLRALGRDCSPDGLDGAALADSLLSPGEFRGLTPDDAFRPPTAQSDDPAFLQFTSGSTGRPRAVRVTHGAVLHNNWASDEAIGAPMGAPVSEWARGLVSWLPLYHDMGLVGCLLMAITTGIDLTLMNPVTFLARPRQWLERLARAGDTFAPAPNFGYQLCVERLRHDGLEGIDLSRWRTALTGAEMVRPETIRAFCELTARTGFRPGSICPCYGLAEATLAVTFDMRGQGLRTLPFPAEADSGVGLAEVVSVGSPVRDTRVRVVATDGAPLPDGAIGEVQVSGPGVSPGYWEDEEADREARDGDWLRTGDLGFVRHGELYLTGRVKDLLILKGQNVMPHEIEWLAESVADCGGTSRCGAFSVARGTEGEQAVLVIETGDRNVADIESLDRDIRSRIGRALALPLSDLVWVRRGQIPRTTSGKVQRRLLRRLYLDGALERLE